MGVSKNIGINTFPIQGLLAGLRVNVCFNYDTENSIQGTLVRDDAEDPFVQIIRLDDGRFVLTTECQYQPYGVQK